MEAKVGQTLKPLASKETGPAIFDKRFVVELCEKIHVHYRNLRVLLSPQDFTSVARGMADALKRWEAQGSPEPDPKTHIELCRKEVAQSEQGKGIQINLNRNLYKANEGRIFSEGAEFSEPIYIHLKIRDLRLEMSLDEFNALHEAVNEASEAMKVGA